MVFYKSAETSTKKSFPKGKLILSLTCEAYFIALGGNIFNPLYRAYIVIPQIFNRENTISIDRGYKRPFSIVPSKYDPAVSTKTPCSMPNFCWFSGLRFRTLIPKN